MKKVIALVSILFSLSAYCPPKVDKQASSLDLVEKNYNKVAYVSGGLLLTSAALNHNKLMLLAHSYYVQVSPYFTQSNLGKASLAGGLALAAPLLYLKYKGKNNDKN